MLVKPELLEHPKFLGLARRLNSPARAALVLLRLWAHCERDMRGGNWGQVSADYVEMTVGWKGKKGLCFQALRYPYGDDLEGRGWIDVVGHSLVVCGWSDINWRLEKNWENGRSTREKWKALKANGLEKRKEGTGLGTGQGTGPSQCQGTGQGTGQGDIFLRYIYKNRGSTPPTPSSDVLAAGGKENGMANGEVPASLVVPTAEQMFEFFKSDAGREKTAEVTLEVCRKYAQWQHDNRRWVIRSGTGEFFVRAWQTEVPKWQATERGPDGKKADEKEIAAELERIRAELQWQQEPTRCLELMERRELLEGQK